MSVLEFIAALKWPVVVLLVLGYGSRAIKKHPGLADWIAAYVEKRDVRGKMGPAEFEAITPATSEIVRAAVASDEELAAIASEHAVPGQRDEPAPAPDVSVLRREVVEDLLRSSAQWGYEIAQMGMRTPPELYIRWTSDGRPEILYGAGGRGPETRYMPETGRPPAHVIGVDEAVPRQFKIEQLPPPF